MSRALLLPLWLLLCLAFHLSRTLVLLGGIASPEPLVAVDHALHLAQAARGSQFLAAHGTNWGYDPSFLAGYPKTPIHDPSAGLADVALWIAGTGYRPAAYKVMVALLVAAIPPLLWTSFALLGQSRLALAFAAPLSLLFFWTGFPIALLESGLVSFLFAGAWLPLLLAAFHRWRLRGDFRVWLLLLLVAGPAPFLHPTFLPMAAAPLALAYAATFSFASQRRSWRWHAASWFALALVFLANLFWLLPLYRSWEYRLPAFTFLVGPESDFNFFLRYLAVEPLLAVALALGLLGLPPMLLFSRSRGGGVLALAILWLAAITLFGSAFAPLRALEPLRFHAPLLLLLSAPIAAGLAFLFPARWADAARPATEAPLTPDGPPSSRLLIPRLLLLAAIVFFLAYRFDLFRAAADRSLAEWTDFRPIPAGLPPEATSLLDWLEKSTDRSARILFEDQLRLRERTVPESVHWTPLLPFLVDREFIGGQYQCTPLLHRAAAFGDFSLGDAKIESLPPRAVEAFLERYNVGWIVCWSPASRRVFDSMPQLEKLGDLPRHATPGLKPSESRYFLYRLPKPSGPFALGRGVLLSSRPNEILLSDLHPSGGRLILRHHWLPEFRSDPPLKLFRAADPADPIGFLGIETDKPIPSLRLFNSYRR